MELASIYKEFLFILFLSKIIISSPKADSDINYLKVLSPKPKATVSPISLLYTYSISPLLSFIITTTSSEKYIAILAFYY